MASRPSYIACCTFRLARSHDLCVPTLGLAGRCRCWSPSSSGPGIGRRRLPHKATSLWSSRAVVVSPQVGLSVCLSACFCANGAHWPASNISHTSARRRQCLPPRVGRPNALIIGAGRPSDQQTEGCVLGRRWMDGPSKWWTRRHRG